MVSEGQSVYMKNVAQDMRQHLMLNQSRLSTAEEEFSRDDKGQAGFVAPVGKGLAKGGKPDGLPRNFGMGCGTKGKGKMHKGLGFQPECGEQRKFGGYCSWCWRIGHKEAQCWFTQEYMKSTPSRDPLQRDIRAWSNTSDKGEGHSQPKKVKVKTRARENIQEREPQPGPDWISE